MFGVSDGEDADGQAGDRAAGRPAPCGAHLVRRRRRAARFHNLARNGQAANLRHNPWVSLCVDDEAPPFAFVKVDGTADLIDNLEQLRHWATRIAGRYMGAALADTYGNRNAVPGELLVRVTIRSITGQDDVAGW